MGEETAGAAATYLIHSDETISSAINDLCQACHSVATEKGWWDEERSEAECIALMHSELSEALEAVRAHNPPSEHIPAFTGLEEEMADVLIRVFDFAGEESLDLSGALIAKIRFNQSREYRHGGKRL